MNPTCDFTSREWEDMRLNGGRDYVTNARERMNNSARTNNNGGYGHGHGGCSNGGHGKRNIAAVGNFKIKMISSDPPQFLYSDDGLGGHFAPAVDILYEKYTSNFAKMILGKWQSIDDGVDES